MWITLLENGGFHVESPGKPGKSGLLFGLPDLGLCHARSCYPPVHGQKHEVNKGFFGIRSRFVTIYPPTYQHYVEKIM